MGFFLVVKKSSCFVLQNLFMAKCSAHYIIDWRCPHMTWIYKSPSYPNSMITRPGFFFWIFFYVATLAIVHKRKKPNLATGQWGKVENFQNPAIVRQWVWACHQNSSCAISLNNIDDHQFNYITKLKWEEKHTQAHIRRIHSVCDIRHMPTIQVLRSP
jgi:hypothetical protein